MKKTFYLIRKIYLVSFLVLIILPSFYSQTLASVTPPGSTSPLEFKPLDDTSVWMKGVDPTNPEKFFQNLFNIALAVAATLAIMMIMYGGVKYMTTDAWQGKNEAKDIIESAVTGLVLALVSWLILYTINPDILNIRI